MIVINPIDIKNWNELILTHFDYSFFHTKEWVEVLSSTYGYKPVYICNSNNNAYSSIIPTMQINSPITEQKTCFVTF